MRHIPNSLRHSLIQLLVLVVAVVFLNVVSAQYVQWYSSQAFTVLQKLRCVIFNVIPFSFGDVLYSFTIGYLLYSVFQFFRQKKWKQTRGLLIGLLRFVNITLVLSILIFLFWSALYSQAKLQQCLALPSAKDISPQMLIDFDANLIKRMNQLAVRIDSLPTKQLNTLLGRQYRQSGIPFLPKTKPSLLGNGLSYFGIEGYFNPFSGEAQINAKLPNFILPFVMAHEMAHQTGIAAEDDANLMAYIQCVESNNVTMQYSACFNIWLYTHRRVRKIDSNIAGLLKTKLNYISLRHIALLKQRNIQYHTFLDDWSSYLFDAFLKMGNQEEGIASYQGVAYSALCWEQKRHFTNDSLGLRFP
jgi:hypothetical protein